MNIVHNTDASTKWRYIAEAALQNLQHELSFLYGTQGTPDKSHLEAAGSWSAIYMAATKLADR